MWPTRNAARPGTKRSCGQHQQAHRRPARTRARRRTTRAACARRRPDRAVRPRTVNATSVAGLQRYSSALPRRRRAGLGRPVADREQRAAIRERDRPARRSRREPLADPAAGIVAPVPHAVVQPVGTALPAFELVDSPRRSRPRTAGAAARSPREARFDRGDARLEPGPVDDRALRRRPRARRGDRAAGSAQ